VEVESGTPIASIGIRPAGETETARKKQAVRPGPDALNSASDTGVSFELLSGFEYKQPVMFGNVEGGPPDQIPAPVRALDGQRISLTGFMAAYDLKQGRVRKFMLMRDRRFCCYGAQLTPIDWVDVHLDGDLTVEAIQDVPTTVTGVMHVEESVENRWVTRIYRLVADAVHPADESS
jgi:hypothetical protein